MNFVIKVADFGLAEQLESKDYFRQDKGGAVKLPIKWLALESLVDSIFSEKTDVVSDTTSSPNIVNYGIYTVGLRSDLLGDFQWWESTLCQCQSI